MEHNFWHSRWLEGRIGFHQAEFNVYMMAHWSALNSVDGQVFVPLCGRSRDLLWLRERSKAVLGVELSEKACSEFFLEQSAQAERSEEGDFTSFEADKIRLLCGDLFNLTADQVMQVVAVYDRAALIALPPLMRQAYAAHLCAILPSGVSMLLIVLEFDGEEGPPFSVSEAEVELLYSARFDIRLLHVAILSEGKDKGRREKVYQLLDRNGVIASA